MRKTLKLLLNTLLAAPLCLVSFNAIAQDLGIIGPSPYNFTTETWRQPFAQDGRTWGGNSGVWVQNKDRIFFLQRGEFALHGRDAFSL